MAVYLVKTRIEIGDQVFLPGTVIELSPKEAANMPWALERAPAAEAGRAITPQPASRQYRVFKAFQEGANKHAVGDVIELLETEATRLGEYLQREDARR